MGCGTGLSFPLLAEAVGPHGRIVGIEQCPEMLVKARERLASVGPCEVSLINAPVESARWAGQADAVLFHFTHDVLRRPEAIANVLQHLKPGARVVATGLQWADPWAWPVNLFVWGAALRSVSTLDGLVQPWSDLAAHVPGLDVRSTWMGGIYIASGTWPGHQASPHNA
ncbi:Methyltransferase domain protein [compost metagenome]